MSERLLCCICLCLLGFLGGVWAQAGPYSKKYELFLPPDVDVFLVVGSGRKPDLTQFEAMRKSWQESRKESAQVEAPKTMGSSAAHSPADQTDEDNARQLANMLGQQRDVSPPLDGAQADSEKREMREEQYGLLDEQLQRWIERRATSLIERLDRYNEERLMFLEDSLKRIVLNVLQLNTIGQLEDLVAEKVAAFSWLEKKLLALKNLKRFNELESHLEVSAIVWQAMREIVQIEAHLKGTNDPGKQWLKNAAILKRIMNEQRFSVGLENYIRKFLTNEFSLMKRSTLLDILQGASQVDTGLIYWAARGKVSADFPFSAQDAIANGDTQ